MIKNLIGIRLLALFTGTFGGKGKRKRAGVAASIGLAVFLVALFAFYFLMISASLAFILVPLGLDAAYFSIFNLLTFGLVFILSIFETKSELFECKDNELLLSMPIRPRDVILSRSLAIIIMNVVEAMIVTVPAVVMYGIAGGSAMHIPTAIISSLFLTLLATALSSAVGYAVALLAARFKNNSFVTVAFSLGFFALYFVGYSALMDGLTSLESDAVVSPDVIESYMAPMFPFGKISMLDPLYLPIFIVISSGITLLAWYIISKNYVKLVSASARIKTKKYVKRALTRSSAFAALSKKELAYFFSNAAYILNGTMGAIFQLIISFAILFSGDTLGELGAMMGVVSDEGALIVIITALLIGISSTNSVSASALSLEGKCFWILKTSPIRTGELICAKLVPHLAVSLPVSLISSVAVAIALKASVLWWFFIILAPIAASIIFAMLGLILNIAMPKFNFENAAQVVKQSMPVFILTLGGMVIAFLFAVLAFISTLALGSVITALILSAALVLLFLGLYLILFGPSKRRLERLS